MNKTIGNDRDSLLNIYVKRLQLIMRDDVKHDLKLIAATENLVANLKNLPDNRFIEIRIDNESMMARYIDPSTGTTLGEFSVPLA